MNTTKQEWKLKLPKISRRIQYEKSCKDWNITLICAQMTDCFSTSHTFCNSGFIRYLLSVCVHKKYGTAEDYATAESGIISSIARLSNEQRKMRFVIPKDDGTFLYTVKSKKPKQPYLWNREGNDKRAGVFLCHVDEARNEEDPFVQAFIDNPKIMKDPNFLQSLKAIKVSVSLRLHDNL